MSGMDIGIRNPTLIDLPLCSLWPDFFLPALQVKLLLRAIHRLRERLAVDDLITQDGGQTVRSIVVQILGNDGLMMWLEPKNKPIFLAVIDVEIKHCKEQFEEVE